MSGAFYQIIFAVSGLSEYCPIFHLPTKRTIDFLKVCHVNRAIQHNPEEPSTASTAQCSPEHPSTVQNSPVQPNTVQWSPLQPSCSPVHTSTAQYSLSSSLTSSHISPFKSRIVYVVFFLENQSTRFFF